MKGQALGRLPRPPGAGANRRAAPVRALVLQVFSAGFCLDSACAQNPLGLRLGSEGLDLYGLTQADLLGPLLLVLAGLTIFSVTVSIMHVKARRAWNERDAGQSQRLADLQARLDRSTLFLSAEPHLTIAFDGRNGEPEFEGDPSLVMDSAPARRILVFTNWLPPAEAAELDRAVSALKSRGEPFRLTLRTTARNHVEAQGQAVAGRAVLRLRTLAGERLEIIRLEERLAAAISEGHALKALLDAVPQPLWLRTRDGRLAWVNAAYAAASEARDAADAVSRGIELLEARTRTLIEATRDSGQPYRAEVKCIVAGQRRTLEVVDVSSPGGSAGLANDLSALKAAKGELKRQGEAHLRLLNELPTAVAVFDGNQRLVTYNRAFADLWQTDPGFLDSQPQASALLDRLRDEGRLPAQNDYRVWKADILASLQANDITPTGWLLPSGRALRVVVSPDPQGGATILFDDVTENHDLATNYNRLETMQGETLEALSEGVAVFGANGRLQLCNPSFARLWGFDPRMLDEKPHIDALASRVPQGAAQDWASIGHVVCGLPEERIGRTYRTLLSEGRLALASIATPLPEGATLLTTTDITASVSVEEALRERNEALEHAARMRSDLIKSVSFELRSPLTSVVGMAQMLASGTAGALNDRQRGYANDLMQASNAVLALFKDILDLTSIEAGTVELEIGPLDAARCINEAVRGLEDRLGEAKVRLSVELEPDVGFFPADHRRMRQVIYNLLANAVAISEPGGTVRLLARREAGQVVFEAVDNGRSAFAGDLARPSEPMPDGGQGLRLSICRSIVEMHGGTIGIRAGEAGERIVRLTLPGGPEPVAAERPDRIRRLGE